jgi:hypothetical protein
VALSSYQHPPLPFAQVAYLGSWAFVVSIKVTRFIVGEHPFFFEALAQVENNTFLF